MPVWIIAVAAVLGLVLRERSVGAHDERELRTTAGLPPGSDRRADSYCDFYDLRQLARLEIQMSSPPNDPVWRVDAK